MQEVSWRGLQVRLLALLLALLAVMAGAIAWYALDAARGWFAQEAEKKASAVARTVQQPLDRALQLGIGFEQMRGVRAYFDTILADNRDIVYLSLSDAEGRVLRQRGLEVPPEEIAAATQALLRSEAEELSSSLAALPYLNTSLRLTVLDETVGVLHVGSDPQYALQRIGRLYLDVVLLVVAFGVIGLELIMAAYRRAVRQRLGGLLAMMRRVVAHDYGLVANLRGGEPIARLGERVAGAIRRINAAYYFFAGWAEEVKASQIDDAVTRRIDTVVDDVRGRFAYTPVRSVPTDHRHDPGDVRCTLFFLMLAAGLSLPLLPAVLPELAENGLAAWLALAPALLPAGTALGLLLASWLGRRLAAGSALRAAPLPAGLLLGAVPLWHDPAILAAGLLALGLALGLVAALALAHDVEWPGRPPFHGLGHAMGAGLTGMLVGPPVAGLLAEEVAGPACLAAPALAAGIAFVVALSYGGNAGLLPERSWGGLGLGGRWRFLRLAVGVMLPGGVAFGLLALNLLPRLLAEAAGGPGEAGRLLAVGGAAALPAALAMLLPGRLALALWIGLLTAGGILLGAAMLPEPASLWLALPGVGVLGAMLWLVLPARLAAAAEPTVAGDGQARALLLLGSLAVAAGAALSGLPLPFGTLAFAAGVLPLGGAVLLTLTAGRGAAGGGR